MIDVYAETGQKMTFAGALEWPGWCRGRRDETEALEALVEYGPRYADVLRPAGIAFEPPQVASVFKVVERLPGNSTTDFGAPGIAPTRDAEPVDEDELARLRAILVACGQAFDRAVEMATGKELRRGPRGGGRELDTIMRHVVESDAAYLGQIGWKFRVDKTAPVEEELARIRQAIGDGLAASAHGELPTHGPRGGARWGTRYFARRVAWHELDHAWEIEDRAG